MRQARLKRNQVERSFYMVTARITGGSFVLGDVEKERLRRLIFGGERRFAYEVWDYCLMSNHLHVLLMMPPVGKMGRSDVLQRWQMTQSGKDPGDPGDGVLEGYRVKIHDLSHCVSNFQQRFTQWFNKRNGRWGRLFGDRFNSVLVDEQGAVARMMAYITLNPVRAGIVDDPADYRWSGYGERIAGRALQRDERPIAQLIGAGLGLRSSQLKGTAKSVMPTLWKRFRECLLGHRVERNGTDAKTLAEILNRVDKPIDLTWPQRLMLKARFITQGAVIGSREFVHQVAQESGRIRPPQQAREWDDTYSLKKHRKRLD